jgi:lysophospholipase L1-like esterase
MSGNLGRNLGLKLLLSAAALAIAIAAGEAALRIAGFRYQAGVHFGWPQPEHLIGFAPDPELFWRLPPDNEAINSLGFPGAEIAPEKPAGAYRVVFLGDSCTWGGYPLDVERLLNERNASPGRRFESIALAVPGYTTHQGLLVARKYGELVDPDVVFIYYGWNDHWRARGSIDREKRIPPPDSGLLGRARAWLLAHARLAQWLASATDRRATKILEEPRVPPDDYRSNLTAMNALFAERSVPVVFITAPTSYYRLGYRKSVGIETGLVGSGEEAIELHRRYNAIVREVAASQGAFLLDLEAEMNELPDIEAYFREDGIHFSKDTGRLYVAGRIADFIAAEILGGGNH